MGDTTRLWGRLKESGHRTSYTHVVLAMIYGQAGSRAEAIHEVDEILRLYPDFADKAVFEFERRNIDPAIIARMVDGLRKAGLDVAPHWDAASGKG